MYVGGVMVGVTNNLVSALADFSERYDQVMHAVSREVSRQGYTPAEGRIIEILGGRILSQAYLRTRTHIERGQLSRAINNLISKGFVERSRGLSTSWPVYRLTETGLDQHHRVNRARHDAIKAMLKKMLRPDRMAMINALEKLGKREFVDEYPDEHERYRTAYPGEVAQIISNALDFYRGNFPFKFNSQIEGYVLRQFAEACDRTHHHIIVYEWYGYVAGSVLLLVDQKSATARLEGLWFSIWYVDDERTEALLKLALQRATSAGCKTVIARIPRNPCWPNIFGALGWTFLNVETQKIAGHELEIETWSLSL